jgi:hypothetical protein
VSTDQSFLVHISRLRRIIVRRLMRRCLVTTCLFSLILITIVLGIEKIGLFQWYGYSIHPFIVLIAFASSVLYTLRTKKAFLDELIGIDIRLDLKERLSTAYEYHQRGRRSLFVDLLIKDATHVLGLIKESQIFPTQFSPSHILIPVFATVMIVLLVKDFSPTAHKQDESWKGLTQIGIKIERYSKKKIQGGKERDKRSPNDLYQKMEKIAKELKNQSTTKERLLKSLGELRKEAEIERTLLAHKLHNELSLGDTSDTPMLNALKKEKINPNELSQIKEELKGLFEGEVPASISQEISDLNQSLQLEQFLGETESQVRSALKEDDGFLLLDEKKQAVRGKDDKEMDKIILSGQARASLQSSRLGDERSTSSTPGKAKTGSEEGEKGGKAVNDDQAFTAGKGQSDGKKKPPYPLNGSKRPALKDKGVSGPGERYNVHVRSLPTIGKAKIEEEEIIRPYRKEIEDVLKKEDIPLHYREYIKSYFLSIGLREEEDTNDGSQ